MLLALHIENIAVIEQADINFDGGFNVLTGETGAGKSIVIDAINAILGERMSREVIRTGSSRAFVSAVFQDIPALPWFAENGIVPEDGEVQIQRELLADGRNVCRVCGVPVTVSLLRKLGTQLINIHGQHDSQQLFDEGTHLQYLDQYAANGALREEYAAAYGEVLRLRDEIDRLSMDEGEKARRMEMLEHQIAEIEQAELTAGEDTELESRRRLLQNSEKLVSGLEDAILALYGDDDRDGAAAMLADAQRAIGRLTDYGEEVEALHSRITELVYLTQDAAGELRDLRDSFEFSGEELERIEGRLDTIRRLRRKYGADVEAILQYLEEARAELDEITFAGDRLERLQADLADQEKVARAAAMRLREARKSAAETLSGRILSELEQLDMPRVRFQCEFEETVLSADGMDAVRFLMSANAGESLKPMSKVASGGELARIMLAMKNVLAEQDAVPTLIFDEVDAGVSGRAAQKVAEKLLAVAQKKQVLCVTHLPQIAAMANTHFRVSKAERQGRTYTSVEPLDLEGRKEELARIIGGAQITETTLRSAGEMLRAGK